jgi:ABC-type glycerol-3-phosphate transport system substrate-binding protein
MKALFLPPRASAIVVILCLWSLFLFTVSSHAATTIRWLTLSDGAWPDSVKKVIAAFEAQNPDIKVELDTYPFRDLFETIENESPGC